MFKRLITVLMLTVTLLFIQPAEASKNTGKNQYTYSEQIFLKRYNDYIHLISMASDRTGVPMDELAAFIKIESGFNKGIVNKQYNASGLLQHIPSTWNRHKKTYGKEMGISRNASVFDPKASLFIGAAAMADERNKLAKATHRTPDEIQTGDLYLAHLYGYDRAVKLLNAPASHPASRYVRINCSSGVGCVNKKPVKTMGEFRASVNAKFEKEKSLFQNKTREYMIAKLVDETKLRIRLIVAANM